MNVKKLLGVALCSVFSMTLAISASSTFHDSNFANSVASKSAINQQSEYSPDDFLGSVALDRDDFTVDINSVTTTSSTAKSAKIEFNSVRLTGYGTSKKTVYVVIDDENFSGDPSDPSLDISLTKPYYFSGYTIEIADITASANLVIPEQMTYGSIFVIQNTKIVANALSFNAEEGYTPKITSLTIPDGITDIDAGAIVNVPDSVTIYCEAASKPIGWSDSWTDANNVVWGYELTDTQNSLLSQATGSNIKTDYEDATTYILGYIYETKASTWYCPSCKKTYTNDEIGPDHLCPEDGSAFIEIPDVRPAMNYPLVVSYTINTSNGGTRDVCEALPITYADESNINPYNSVTSSSYSRDFDIILNDGETVDFSSFVFYNIFKSTTTVVVGKDSTGVDKEFNYIIPDLATSYSSIAKKRFASEIDIKDIIDYKFTGVTTFGDYTMVSMNVDKVMPSYYETAMASTVASNQLKIDSGVYRIRYAFYDISNSKYRIAYDDDNNSSTADVEKEMSISTPLSVIVLEHNTGNQLSFLIKNSEVGQKFSADKLRRFEFVSLTINIHLWDNTNQNIVSRTACSIHFSEIDVMPSRTSHPQVFSISLFLLIFNIIYLLAFAGGSVGLFFFEKEKYKNDEFRRVKPKQFVERAAVFYVGSAIVLFTILSIIFRFGIFDNSIATTNPIDWFVVIAGIISIVLIGYFVKYLVTVIRVAKQRKLTYKLKLNEDIADDGTN